MVFPQRAVIKKGCRPKRSRAQPISGRRNSEVAVKAEKSPPMARALAPMDLPYTGNINMRNTNPREPKAIGRSKTEADLFFCGII